MEESVDHLVQGVYNDSQGVLVSTNTRLIFIDKGLIYGLKVEDFPLDKISSIEYETGLLMSKIKIYTSNNKAIIEEISPKNYARLFSEFVRKKLSDKTPSQYQNDIGKTDVLDQIEKLSKLKEKGILTEEEFNEQKQKLLNKL
ncbi:MAG: PH domain-containing protein [Crocinitomicaceae bacterium]|nr:PH domain-containing protein [Crocinitomicaceae bacterium]